MGEVAVLMRLAIGPMAGLGLVASGPGVTLDRYTMSYPSGVYTLLGHCEVGDNVICHTRKSELTD